MKKQLIFSILFAALVLGLTGSAQAISDQAAAGSLSSYITITPTDLGVTHVGALPTSHFYFLKQWGHSITRLVTFSSIGKAKLELNFTNQNAAELLEVWGTHQNDPAALKKALQNYTQSQERLNFRISTISGTANVQGQELAKLLADVDAKTAKHAELLEQVATNTATGTITNDDADVSKILDNALNNIQKTFTITVTSVNDAPALKQKATDEIAAAEIAITQAETVYGEPVIFTATLAAPGSGTPTGNVTFLVCASGQHIKEADLKSKTSSVTGHAITATYNGDANFIINAKGCLVSAKLALAAGQYGQAYGLARSAEAKAAAVHVAAGDVNGDGILDKTAPTPSPTGSEKINENESPKPTDKKSVTPTPVPTPTPTPSDSVNLTPEPTPSPTSDDNSAGNPMGNGAAGQ